MSDALRPSDDLDTRWEAIARFAAGESDASESAEVTAWLTAHPEDAELVALVNARAAHAEQQANAQIPRVDTDRALASVLGRLDAPSRPVLTVERGGASYTSRSDVTAPRRWRIGTMAAAAAVVAIGALAVWKGRSTEPMTLEYRTAVGKRDSLQLPDGSTVVLAPGSRLTIAREFRNGTREVTLEGAAFFNVVHDDAHPFTVHAAGAEIRDVGTAFSVKTTAGNVAVAVTHGIVAVRREPTAARTDTATELHAGDRATLDGQTVRVQRGVVTADDVAWTRGQLAYRDASLAEVQADLARWYGITLQVSDSTLARRTLTATFRGDSAEQVVQLVALALGADVVHRGDTVILQPASGSTSPSSGAGAPP